MKVGCLYCSRLVFICDEFKFKILVIKTNQQICILFRMVYYIKLMLPLNVSVVNPPWAGGGVSYATVAICM
jgi:hypothetical protein